jgi:FixJ family two-component response regulator
MEPKEMPESPVISIVDDDFSTRKATIGLIGAGSLATQPFMSPEDLPKSSGLLIARCLIPKTQMSGISRRELQIL